MRVMILLLFALAIGKIATQSYIQRQSAKKTIMNAYREHALAACQAKGFDTGHAWSGQSRQSATRRGFADTSKVSFQLVIGKRDLNVRLWQTSHRSWSARYADPFIIIRTRNGPNGAGFCEYNVSNGSVHASAAAHKAPGNG